MTGSGVHSPSPGIADSACGGLIAAGGKTGADATGAVEPAGAADPEATGAVEASSDECVGAAAVAEAVVEPPSTSAR